VSSYPPTAFPPWPPPGDAAQAGIAEQGWFVKDDISANWEGVAPGNTNFVSSGDGVDGRFVKWSAGIFDLRPEFKGAPASTNVAERGVVPIFKEGNLAVMVEFRDCPFGSLDDLNITAWDEANPWDPNDLRPVTAEQDVTTQFVTATAPYGTGVKGRNQRVSGLGFFTPPQGSRGPARYWKFNLVFRCFLVHADPRIVVTAAYY
jgi:hypothetical protein